MRECSVHYNFLDFICIDNYLLIDSSISRHVSNFASVAIVARELTPTGTGIFTREGQRSVILDDNTAS